MQIIEILIFYFTSIVQVYLQPVYAYCSDGIGRTGTFCAMMLCRQRLLTEHMADVFFAIKTIRAQRPGLVENSVRKVYHYNCACILFCFRNNLSSFTRH